MKHEHRISAKALSFLLALVMLLGCVSVGFTALAVEDSYQALAEAMRADGMQGVTPSYKRSASPSVKNKLSAADPHAASSAYVHSIAMWNAMDAFWKVALSVRTKEIGDIAVGDTGAVISGWTGENNTARKVAAAIAGKLVSGGYMTAEEIAAYEVFDNFNLFIGGFTAEHALQDEPVRGEKPSGLPYWSVQLFGTTGYFGVTRSRDEALYAGTKDYKQIPAQLELNKRWTWAHTAPYAKNAAGNVRQYWHVLDSMSTQINVAGVEGLAFDPAEADTAALKVTLGNWDALFTEGYFKQDLGSLDQAQLEALKAQGESFIAGAKALKITNSLLYFYGLPTYLDVNFFLGQVDYHLGLAPYRPMVKHFKNPKKLSTMSLPQLKEELLLANQEYAILEEISYANKEIYTGLQEVNGLSLETAEEYVDAILQAIAGVTTAKYYYDTGDTDDELLDLFKKYFSGYTAPYTDHLDPDDSSSPMVPYPAAFTVKASAFGTAPLTADYNGYVNLYLMMVSFNEALTGSTAGAPNFPGYDLNAALQTDLVGSFPAVAGQSGLMQTALESLEKAIIAADPKYTFDFSTATKPVGLGTIPTLTLTLPSGSRPEASEVVKTEPVAPTQVTEEDPPGTFDYYTYEDTGIPNYMTALPLPTTWTATPAPTQWTGSAAQLEAALILEGSAYTYGASCSLHSLAHANAAACAAVITSGDAIYATLEGIWKTNELNTATYNEDYRRTMAVIAYYENTIGTVTETPYPSGFSGTAGTPIPTDYTLADLNSEYDPERKKEPVSSQNPTLYWTDQKKADYLGELSGRITAWKNFDTAVSDLSTKEDAYAYLQWATTKYKESLNPLSTLTADEKAMRKMIFEEAYAGYYTVVRSGGKTYGEVDPVLAYEDMRLEFETAIARKNYLYSYYAFFNPYRLDHKQTDFAAYLSDLTGNRLKDEVNATRDAYNAAKALDASWGTVDNPLPPGQTSFIPKLFNTVAADASDLPAWLGYFGDHGTPGASNNSVLMGVYLAALQDMLDVTVPAEQINDKTWEDHINKTTGVVQGGKYQIKLLSLISMLRDTDDGTNDYTNYYVEFFGPETAPKEPQTKIYKFLLDLYRAMNGIFDSYYAMHWEYVAGGTMYPPNGDPFYPVREVNPDSHIVLQIPNKTNQRDPQNDTFVVRYEHLENMVNKLDTLLSSEMIKPLMGQLGLWKDPKAVSPSPPAPGLQGAGDTQALPPGGDLPAPNIYIPNLDGDKLKSMGEMRYSDKELVLKDTYTGITITMPKLDTMRDQTRVIDSVTGDKAIRKWIQAYRADVLLYLLHYLFYALENGEDQNNDGAPDGWATLSWVLKLLLEDENGLQSVNGAPPEQYYQNLEPPAEIAEGMREAFTQVIGTVDLSAATEPFITQLLSGLISDNLYTDMLPNTVLGLYKSVCDMVWGLFEDATLFDKMWEKVPSWLVPMLKNTVGLSSINNVLNNKMLWSILKAIDIPVDPITGPKITSMLELLIGAEITPSDLVKKCWPTGSEDFAVKYNAYPAFVTEINKIKAKLSNANNFPVKGANAYKDNGLNSWLWIEKSAADIAAAPLNGGVHTGYQPWAIKDLYWGLDKITNAKDRRDAFIDIMSFTMSGISLLLGTVFGKTDLKASFRVDGLRPAVPSPVAAGYPAGAARYNLTSKIEPPTDDDLAEWGWSVLGSGFRLMEILGIKRPTGLAGVLIGWAYDLVNISIPIQEWMGYQDYNQTKVGSFGIPWPFWKGKYDARAGIFATLTAANAYGKVMIPLFEMLNIDKELGIKSEVAFNTELNTYLNGNGNGVAAVVKGFAADTNTVAGQNAYNQARKVLQNTATVLVNSLVRPLLNWIDPDTTALIPYSIGFRPLGKVLDLLPNLAYVIQNGMIKRLVDSVLDLRLTATLALGGVTLGTAEDLLAALTDSGALSSMASDLVEGMLGGVLGGSFGNALKEFLKWLGKGVAWVAGKLLQGLVGMLKTLLKNPDIGTLLGFFAGNDLASKMAFTLLDTALQDFMADFLTYEEVDIGGQKYCKDCTAKSQAGGGAPVKHGQGLLGYLDHMIGIDLTGKLDDLINSVLGMIGLNDLLKTKKNPNQPYDVGQGDAWKKGTILNLIDTVVGNESHLEGFLVELFNPQTYPVRNFMVYPMVGEAAANGTGSNSLNEVNYSEIWTEAKATYLNNHLMEFVNKAWDFLFAEDFLPWLYALLDKELGIDVTNLYTKENLGAILNLISDLFMGEDGYARFDISELLANKIVELLLPLIPFIKVGPVMETLNKLTYYCVCVAPDQANYDMTDANEALAYQKALDKYNAYQAAKPTGTEALAVWNQNNTLALAVHTMVNGVTDRNSFTTVLYKLLAPLAPVLRIFLTGGRTTDAKGNLIETLWYGELYPNNGARDNGYFVPGSKKGSADYVWNTKRYVGLKRETTDDNYTVRKVEADKWVDNGTSGGANQYFVPNGWAYSKDYGKYLPLSYDPKNTFNTIGAEGDNLTLLEDYIGFSGYDGYRHGLIPIYEHLGVPDDEIPSYQQFVLRATAAGTGDEDFFRMLVDPILSMVDELIEDPVTKIFDMLPNLLYFLTAEATDADQAHADDLYGKTGGQSNYKVLGGTTAVNECLNRLLRPIYAILDMVAPLMTIDNVLRDLPAFGVKLPTNGMISFATADSGPGGKLPLTINLTVNGSDIPIAIKLPIEISIGDIVTTLLNGILGDALSDLGLSVTLEDLTSLICGELEIYTSKNGQDDAVRLNGNLPDLLTHLIRKVVELVFTEGNKPAVMDLIAGLGIPDVILPVVKQLVENIYGLMADRTLQGHIGSDLVLSMLFYLFYDVNSLVDELLSMRNTYSSRIINFFEILAGNDSPQLRRYAERSRRFLNLFYQDIINADDGVQRRGFIKFITDFWNSIVAFFKGIGDWFMKIIRWMFPFFF